MLSKGVRNKRLCLFFDARFAESGGLSFEMGFTDVI